MPENPTALGLGDSVIVAETGLGRYQVEARAGSSAFLVDEPASVGGLGSGPNPYDLLGAALGSCTAMTIRLYAERKAWPLTRVQVTVAHHRTTLQARDVFERAIALEGALDETQKAKLLEIAERCPVHLTLDRGADVKTTLSAPVTPPAEPPTQSSHMRDMKEACV